MKKIFVTAVAAAALAAPALAGTMTISFADDSGETVEMTLNDATMMATVNGSPEFAYTMDEATMTLCGDATGEGEVCVTFTDATGAPAVGATSAYTTTDGGSGTSTVTAISE